MAHDDGSGSTGPRAEGRSEQKTQRRFAAFGERLHTAMKAADLTPADLSGHLRVSTQMIGKYLRGESLPGPDRLQKLSEIVHVPLNQLVKLADEHEPRRPRTPAAYALLHQTEPGREDDTAPSSRTPRVPDSRGSIPDDGISQRNFSALNAWIGEYLGGEREERPPSPRQVIADFLSDWAQTAAPHARADAGVQPYPRVTGPFFRYSPALMIVGDEGPVLAVEIMASRLFATWPSVVGQALNWKEATGGKPFFVVWLLREETPDRPHRNENLAREAERTLIAMKTADLVTDWFIVDEANPLPGLTRLTDRLPGVIRETK